MAAILDLSPPTETALPIDLGAAGTFEIIIRPPSFGSELSCLFSDSPMASRANAAVVGWRGLSSPDGSPIPFSDAAMAELVRKFPDVGFQIGVKVAEYYQTSKDDARKNSEAAPSSGSETLSAETSK